VVIGMSCSSVDEMGIEWPWVARMRYLEGGCCKGESNVRVSKVDAIVVLESELLIVFVSANEVDSAFTRRGMGTGSPCESIKASW